jgi:hypothetical protein
MQVFTPEHRDTFLAAADRIVPADDFPSASQAGAEEYVLRLLAGDLRDRADEFLSGLDLLNLEAAAAFEGRSFAALSQPQQDLVLSRVESYSSAAARAFFSLLVDLVTEGYYADPANGGNREAQSWKMIGYETRVPGDLTSSSRGNLPSRPT